MHRASAAEPGLSSSVMSSERSKPTKRIRWATQRAPAHKGDRIRQSVVDRFHRRKASEDRKAEIGDGDFTKAEADVTTPEPGTGHDSTGRRIFFNTPLPDDARDEDGHPLMRYARNKIRTAKYTPLSFLPKNLWFQFHNVANIYFLFIVILSVRFLPFAVAFDLPFADLMNHPDLSALRRRKRCAWFSTAHRHPSRHSR